MNTMKVRIMVSLGKNVGIVIEREHRWGLSDVFVIYLFLFFPVEV